MLDTGTTKSTPQMGVGLLADGCVGTKGKSPALQDGFDPAWVQAVPEEEAAAPARCALFILPMMMDALSTTDLVSFP